MEKKIYREKLKKIILAIVVLILLLSNLIIFINHLEKQNFNNNNKTNIVNSTSSQNNENIITNNETNSTNFEINTTDDEEKTKNALEDNISSMGERNRMQTYFGQFILLIEKNEYEEAYLKLNTKFKENYFKTLDDFKKYVTEKYPKAIRLEYTNIERQGEYYILSVNIYDTFDSTKVISQSTVVKENGNDDYEISFQVE